MQNPVRNLQYFADLFYEALHAGTCRKLYFDYSVMLEPVYQLMQHLRAG